MEGLFRTPYRVYLEQRAMTRDGWRWLGWMDTAVRGEDGEAGSIIGVGRDITKRKQAEERLRLYERVISNTQDMMSFVDRDYIYRTVNDAYVRGFGKSKEAVIGHTIADLLGEQTFENTVKPHMDRCFAGEQQQFQGQFLLVDGSITRKYGGTGLGLAISKNLIDLMGGEIEVSSRLGRGSSFELRLPLTEPKGLASYPQTRVYPTVSAPAGEARLAGLRILIAEDNAVNRLVLDDMLLSEGCRLDQVENGELAVQRVRDMADDPYNLVLMDVQMPVMDGYQATRHILELAPGLPVIGLTAHALAEEREKCLAAGVTFTVMDISGRRHAEQTLKRNEARLRTLLAELGRPVHYTNADGGEEGHD